MDYQREKIYRDIREYIGMYIDPNLYKLLFIPDLQVAQDEISYKDLEFLSYKYGEKEKIGQDLLENYRKISNKLEVLYRSKKISRDENKKIMDLLKKYCSN